MNVRVSSHFLSPTLLLHLLLHATLMLLLLISLMHQSNPTVPSHPAPAHMYLVSPGSGVLANFAWFRVRWGALELLTCTWFPTLIVYNQTWKILEQAQADWQIGSSIKDAKKLVEVFRGMFSQFMQAFLHCFIKTEFTLRERRYQHTWINVFFLIESNFFWSRIWIKCRGVHHCTMCLLLKNFLSYY